MAKQRASSRIVSVVTAIVASATMPGCAPYMMSYVYLDGPGVTYKRAPCADGAAVGVAYERSGVRFEVSLEPHNLSTLQQAYLKVRAPRNVAVSIPDPNALITFRGQDNPTQVLVQAASLDWQGPYVERMRRESPLAEYRFVLSGIPRIDMPGTLTLPAVLADGVKLESPRFSFERRTHAGIAPWNC